MIKQDPGDEKILQTLLITNKSFATTYVILHLYLRPSDWRGTLWKASAINSTVC